MYHPKDKKLTEEEAQLRAELEKFTGKKIYWGDALPLSTEDTGQHSDAIESKDDA